MPMSGSDPTQAWTDSERAALDHYRDTRDAAGAAAQAQAELHAELQQRAAEKRLQEAHVQTLIAQVADLTVVNRANDKRMRDAERKLEEVARGLAENTIITVEVRDLLAAFKGGFRVLGWLGTGFKWLAGLAAAGLSLWAAWETFRTGHPPK
jgi:hypothetical protein